MTRPVDELEQLAQRVVVPFFFDEKAIGTAAPSLQRAAMAAVVAHLILGELYDIRDILRADVRREWVKVRECLLDFLGDGARALRGGDCGLDYGHGEVSTSCARSHTVKKNCFWFRSKITQKTPELFLLFTAALLK
jgi:hypothetical protein